MVKVFCDNCKIEITDQYFRFEATVIEVKHVSVLNTQPQVQPEVIKKQIHLCQKCYNEKLDL